MVDRIADPWGRRTPHARGTEWSPRVDKNLTSEPERWVQSACVLCSNGCALDIGVAGGRIVGVRGRPDNLTVLSVGELLADTIMNVFADDSVSAIFGGENQLF